MELVILMGLPSTGQMARSVGPGGGPIATATAAHTAQNSHKHFERAMPMQYQSHAAAGKQGAQPSAYPVKSLISRLDLLPGPAREGTDRSTVGVLQGRVGLQDFLLGCLGAPMRNNSHCGL